MKTFKKYIAYIIALFFITAGIVGAATILPVPQGGTGVNSVISDGILYNPNSDARGPLGSNKFFSYNESAGAFQVGDGAGTDMSIIDAPGGLYDFGDINGLHNHSMLSMDDTTNTINFWSNRVTIPTVPSFTGSGANDLVLGGYSIATPPTQIDVKIDSYNNENITYTGISGGSFVVGQAITVSSGTGSGTTFTVVADDGTQMFVTGASTLGGLDNTSVLDNLMGVTATVGTATTFPDTYEWSLDTVLQSTFVPLPITPTSLVSGIFINFSFANGHVINAQWEWTYSYGYGRNGLLDGQNYAWGFGDLGGFIKGQKFGMAHNGSDPTDWYFEVSDNNGRYLYANPIDAPSRGKFWLGDHDQVTNGTNFFADDANNVIQLQTKYIGNEISPIAVRGGSGLLVKLGDYGATQNGTYITLDDQAEQIEGHSYLGHGRDAYLDLGGLAIPNLSTSATGSFISTTDSLSQQALVGVGQVGGSSDASIFSLVTDTSSNRAGQTVDVLSSVPQVFQTAATASNNMTATMTATGYDIFGGVNGTGIHIDDPSGKIGFNGNYTFPFADGSANQVLQTDGAGNLSFATVGGGTIGGSIASNQVAVGNGTNTIAGSNNFLYTVATGVFQVKDASGNKTIDIAPGSGSWKFGDIDAIGAGTIFRIDNAARVADIRDNSGVYFSADINNGLYELGDITGGGHGSYLKVNDNASGRFSYHSSALAATPGTYLFIDPLGQTFSMGDLSVLGGGLNLTLLDGVSKATIGNTAGRYLLLDKGNNFYEFGDVDGVGNNTNITVNDAGHSISLFAGTTISQQSNSIQWTGTIVYGSTSVVAYGTTTTITFPDGSYTFAVSGSSGATTFLLPTSAGVPLGTTYVFKDLGLLAATSNITINAGTGKVIVGATSAQTKVINSAGDSITVTKVSSTQWAII